MKSKKMPNDLCLSSESNKKKIMKIKIGKSTDIPLTNNNIINNNNIKDNEKQKERKNQKILKIKEKNKELLIFYEEIKQKINIYKNNYIKLESDYNLKIKEDDLEIKLLNKDNLYLKSKIKELKNNLKKIEEEEKKNVVVKHDIKQDISLMNDLIQVNNEKMKNYKKSCEELKIRIKGISSSSGQNEVENLKTKLDNISKQKNKTIEEINDINAINDNHKKYCGKKKKDLLIQLNILKNEYEYELKIKEKKNINNKEELGNILCKIIEYILAFN